MLTKTRFLLCGGALSALVWASTFATFSDSGTAGSTFTRRHRRPLGLE